MKQAAKRAILCASVLAPERSAAELFEGGGVMETGDSDKAAQAPWRKSVKWCYDVPRACRPAQAHSSRGSEDENLAPNANT